jgi:hypothetical protein
MFQNIDDGPIESLLLKKIIYKKKRVPRALVLFLLISYIISPNEKIITFLFCDGPELD